ncbi:1727_t:CDS:2 [Paraglomus brasilianum]|uniref:1727_t:CDS:1 n=1 Tax=Paraglomus brasilianum TaxID=144538 RepID=A0A9N9GLZ9_9GLOM|nr:1727_t:CDS:2 [Paraglomus brasilianum]
MRLISIHQLLSALQMFVSISTNLVPHSCSDPSPSLPTHAYLSNLKERFNYASHVCAAMVLNTNTGARSAHAILTESKDQYMLNECDAGKFVVVQLCNDILIDTIVLANFEFFSSTFKHIRISANNEHPPRKERPWRLLGEYKAGNTRDLQVFKVKDPLLWARYIRIDFVSHYGRQYYCPVSLLRVYGVTMIEDYRRKEEEDSSSGASNITTRINKTDDNGAMGELIDYLKTEEETSKGIDKKLSGENEEKGSEEKSDKRNGGGNGKNEGLSPGNDQGSDDDRKGRVNEASGGEVDRVTNSGKRNLYREDSNFLHTLLASDSMSMFQCPRIHDEKEIFSYPLCKITNDPYVSPSTQLSSQEAFPRIQKEDSNAADTQSIYQKFLNRFSDLELNAIAERKSTKKVLNKILGFMTKLNHNMTGLEERLTRVESTISEHGREIREHGREIRLLSKRMEFYAEISTLEYVIIVWLLILTLVMVAVLYNYYVPQKFLDTIHDLYHTTTTESSVAKRVQELHIEQMSTPPIVPPSLQKKVTRGRRKVIEEVTTGSIAASIIKKRQADQKMDSVNNKSNKKQKKVVDN